MSHSAWFGHALRRTSWRRQRQAVVLAGLGLLMALVVGALVYLSQAAQDATTGRQLQLLIAERNRLVQDNESLRSGDRQPAQRAPAAATRAGIGL